MDGCLRSTLAIAALLVISSLVSPAFADTFVPCADQSDFPELTGTQCALVEQPLRHAQPSGDVIELFVRKFPAASKRKGAVWLVAGGPGESGASFYRHIDTFRQAFDGYDLMVPDHRGTGASSTICPQESTDSVGGTALVGEEWGACFGHMYANPDYVKAFTISEAARDLQSLIDDYSGEGERLIYGVSYGTQLTLRLLTIDSDAADTVVLDSLVPMQEDNEFDLSQRSHVVNSVGQQLLEICDTDKTCGAASQTLKEQLSALQPGVISLKSFDPDLPDTPLSHTLGMVLDIAHLRGALPQVIRDLHQGKSESLTVLIGQMTEYYERFNPGYHNFGSSIPLVQVISASENTLRPTLSKDAVDEEGSRLWFTSPLPGHLAGNSMPTYKRDAYFAKLPEKMPPTLVLHGMLDPKTHYQGAIRHVAALKNAGDVHLISIARAPHFIALSAPGCFVYDVKGFVANRSAEASRCVDETIEIF